MDQHTRQAIGDHASILDAFPSPVFLIDRDLIIEYANLASRNFLGYDLVDETKQLCGNTLNCINAINSGGDCGNTEFCADCGIRQTVDTVISGKSSARNLHDMSLVIDGEANVISFLISGTLFRSNGKNLVILTMEDVTELVSLRKIIPICSHCRRVRDDSDYWQQVEQYFKRFTNIRFTHGICPDCIREHYPDLWEG
jgi:PAS domain-containing protein